MEISEEWLQAINDKFRRQGIHPSARPMLALSKFSKEFNHSFIISQEISNRVTSWFEENTKSGSLALGLMYQGAYYFDTCFWPVDIPMMYGNRIYLDPFNSLVSMQDKLKDQIRSSPEELTNFIHLWIDCLDYAYGYDDILKVYPLNDLAKNFVKSANKELTATVSLLLQDNPGLKAIETARMTTEMILKSILIIKHSWTDEKPLMKIGHDLEKAIDQCVAITHSSELEALKEELDFFPDVNTRYSGKEWKHADLWYGYGIAQYVSAIFTRMFSERDSKSEMRSHL